MIPVLKPFFPEDTRKKILAELDTAFASGWIGQGPKVKELEERWAEFTGAKYAIATNSCTSALDIAVRSVALPETVTVSPFTFISSALAPLNAGHKIKFLDIDPKSHCTPEADIQVMYAGNQYGEGTIYDMAHSGGENHKGLVSCWSFHAVKNLPCVHKDTKIKTSGGNKKALDIKVGDMVLTHKNRYRKVLKTMQRTYVGDMMHIGLAKHAYYKTQKYPFVSVTPEHPILVDFDGEKEWREAKEVKVGDKIFIPTIICGCGKRMPYYCVRCKDCLTPQSYNALVKKNNLEIYSRSKWEEKRRHSTGGTWDRWIHPEMKKYEKNGFRCIPVGHYKVVPDFIAIKNGKVFAVEIEHGRSPSEFFISSNPRKYEGVPYYDSVFWINKKRKNKRRYEYEIDEETGLAKIAVKVSKISPLKRTISVYNYEVEEDNSYTAGNIVVHNCGDGGMITTNSEGVYQKARALSWCGIDKSTFERSGAKYSWDYQIESKGLKAHMNDISAIIALNQLEILPQGNAYREYLASLYDKYLPEEIERPFRSRTWHLYVVEIDLRDKLYDYLAERGIGCGVHYKPLYTYEKVFGVSEVLPNTQKAFESVLSLPMHMEITESTVKDICEHIKNFTRI